MSAQDLNKELQKINKDIAAREALRGIVSAAEVETMLTPLHQKKAELEAQLDTSVGSSYAATVKGSAVVAQGAGATAVGARGVNVGGNVSGNIVTGDRNKVTQVQGDQIKGDKVGGDKITVGDISDSTGIAIGREASATVTQGISGEELTLLFQAVAKQIEARPEDPDVGKEEIEEVVAKIETETSTQDAPNENKLERWIRNLAKMAPDIVEVMAASLISPVAGGTAVLKKIIDKVKNEPKD